MKFTSLTVLLICQSNISSNSLRNESWYTQRIIRLYDLLPLGNSVCHSPNARRRAQWLSLTKHSWARQRVHESRDIKSCCYFNLRKISPLDFVSAELLQWNPTNVMAPQIAFNLTACSTSHQPDEPTGFSGDLEQQLKCFVLISFFIVLTVRNKVYYYYYYYSTTHIVWGYKPSKHQSSASFCIPYTKE